MLYIHCMFTANEFYALSWPLALVCTCTKNAYALIVFVQSDSSDNDSDQETLSNVQIKTPSSRSQRGRSSNGRQGQPSGHARGAGDDEGYEGSGEEGVVKAGRGRGRGKGRGRGVEAKLGTASESLIQLVHVYNCVLLNCEMCARGVCCIPWAMMCLMATVPDLYVRTYVCVCVCVCVRVHACVYMCVCVSKMFRHRHTF